MFYFEAKNKQTTMTDNENKREEEEKPTTKTEPFSLNTEILNSLNKYICIVMV